MSGSLVLAVGLLAGAAVLAGWPPAPGVRLAGALPPREIAPTDAPRRRLDRALALPEKRALVAVALAGVALLAVEQAGVGQPGGGLGAARRVTLGAVVVLAAAVGIGRGRARLVTRRRAALVRLLVAELCAATVAELRAGRSPAAALEAAARSLRHETSAADSAAVDDVLKPLLAAGSRDDDVAGALGACAAVEGAEALRRLAACWQVASRSGAGLAQALERVAEGLAADEAIRREVAAQLAGPRVTARLLTGLPAVGLLLGSGLGADPLGLLTETSFGAGCLVVGVLLTVLGSMWSRRLARSAEPR